MRSCAAQPRRRNALRLRGFDYASPGAYFVTVCTREKASILGKVIGGAMRLSPEGEIVEATWHELPDHFASLELDALAVMPNHVHGILVLHRPVGAGLRPAPTPHGKSKQECAARRRVTLSEVVRAFKSFSARRINAERSTAGAPVWQRGFYEHVIRDDTDLDRIRRYIEENPLRWAEDEQSPSSENP